MPLDESAGKARTEFSSTPPGEPVCACGSDAFDPSYVTSAVPEDLQADERGVYGYVPRPGTEFTKPGWPDWTDPKAVASARDVRLGYHQGLADEKAWVAGMREKGVGDDAIARELVDIRNKGRLSKYTQEQLAMIYQRNEDKYQNKYGPSYESLLAKYGSADEVILAGTRSNAGMDVLTGIATVKPAKL
jgi:hypothetical protein